VNKFTQRATDDDEKIIMTKDKGYIAAGKILAQVKKLKGKD
jgi:hypothetical protein